MLENAILI
jgi:hypothetical protein